jgi:hypothetical protein
LSAVAVVLLGVIGKLGFDKFLVDDPVPAQPVRLQFSLDEKMRLNLAVVGTSTFDDQIAVFGSNDGKSWVLSEFVNDVPLSGSSVILESPISRYMRARYLDGGRLNGVEAIIGTFPTGFSGAPVIVRDGPTVFARWDPVVSETHGSLIRFEYEVLLERRGERKWVEFQTQRSYTSDFAVAEDQATPRFRVRAIFSDGFIGPVQEAITESSELDQ